MDIQQPTLEFVGISKKGGQKKERPSLPYKIGVRICSRVKGKGNEKKKRRINGEID